MPAYLAAFEYVNGGLFKQPHPAPTFNRKSRDLLIRLGEQDWSEINLAHGNACRVDWEAVCPKHAGDEICILGNPPYLGSSMQSAE